MKETCGSCGFRTLDNGDCHRYPPRAERVPSGGWVAMFLYVPADKWCGEWKPNKDLDASMVEMGFVPVPECLDRKADDDEADVGIDGERCDRCGIVGEDRRTLEMRCGAKMNNPDDPMMPYIPFVPFGNRFHTLRVCKQCRADWIAAIGRWFAEGKREDTETDETASVFSFTCKKCGITWTCAFRPIPEDRLCDGCRADRCVDCGGRLASNVKATKDGYCHRCAHKALLAERIRREALVSELKAVIYFALPKADAYFRQKDWEEFVCRAKAAGVEVSD